MARYDLARDTVAKLLADPEVVAIVERYRPGLSTSRDAREVAQLTVDQAFELARRYASPAELAAGRAELEALQ